MRLDKHKFATWLKAKPPAEIVGNKRDCHTCPIANFYCDVTGGSEIIISSAKSGDGYRIDRGSGDRSLPWWADRFLFSVDHGDDDKISARRALEILDAQVD